MRRLLADLQSTAPEERVKRDTAVARLAVIGTRAVRQLLEALETALPEGREALLLALEAIPDVRAAGPVLQALDAPQTEVRVAAVRAARGLLPLSQSTRILDRLTAIALEPSAPPTVRAAALEALLTLPPRTVKPILDRLRDDPTPEILAVLSRSGAQVDDPMAELEEAADGWLPRDPHTLLQLVARTSGDAPLSTLHRLIEKVRGRESEGRAARIRDWAAVRGALHLALARRGSKVALYDLREAFEQAHEPLSADFVSALGLIGDASCLEPLAIAYAQALGMDDGEGWRRALTSAFREIVAREKLTRRHSALKRVRARFRDGIGGLLDG